MAIETIDDVLYKLDQIIATAHDGLDRIGYFACLYRHVTYAVKMGIAQNQFEDGPRMQKLDIAFAGRYFQMLDEWSRNSVLLQSWRIAFEATRTDQPIVTQHLFLAMNPHISLDLALAAAQTCPGAQLASLQNDFNKINDILASLLQKVEDELTDIWPVLKFINSVAQQHNNLFGFSLEGARANAWSNAQRLAYMTADEQQAEILRLDAGVAQLGQSIWQPGAWISLGITLLRWLQNGTVDHIIEVLSDHKFQQDLFTDQAAVQARATTLQNPTAGSSQTTPKAS